MRIGLFPILPFLLIGCGETSTTEEHVISGHGEAADASIDRGAAETTGHGDDTRDEEPAQLD